MVHREGADKTGDVRLDFDRRVRLEFHGSKISSNGGLLLFRELDEVLGLHDIAGGLLRDTRTGHYRLHSLVGLLRQSVFGRLAGYDDVNDADRLSLDPVMRQVVGGRAVDAKAASSSQMGRFETEVLATPMEADWIIQFYNQRGTAEQHIKEGKSRQSTGRASHARAWRRTRSAFSFTHWPTISVSSCKALICPRR